MIDVSIVICSYNNKAYIARAIRSCLKQSFKNLEVIVVDDASTDNSRKIIESFGDKITPVFLDKNVGVAEASNIGIRNALGSYIIRVDSDDYIQENTILFLSEILNQNKDIGFVYADHLRVDEDETVLNRVKLDTIDKLYKHGAGIMFRKSYLEQLGLYDSQYKNAEDFELLSRYIKNFNGFHLPLALYRYRRHDSNMTNDVEARKEWEKKVNENNSRIGPQS